MSITGHVPSSQVSQVCCSPATQLEVLEPWELQVVSKRPLQSPLPGSSALGVLSTAFLHHGFLVLHCCCICWRAPRLQLHASASVSIAGLLGSWGTQRSFVASRVPRLALLLLLLAGSSSSAPCVRLSLHCQAPQLLGYSAQLSCITGSSLCTAVASVGALLVFSSMRWLQSPLPGSSALGVLSAAFLQGRVPRTWSAVASVGGLLVFSSWLRLMFPLTGSSAQHSCKDYMQAKNQCCMQFTRRQATASTFSC